MKKFVTATIAALVVCSLLFAGCGNNMAVIESNSNNIIEERSQMASEAHEVGSVSTMVSGEPEIEPITEDDSTRFYSVQTDRLKYYNTFDELATVASTVVAGVCIEAQPVYKLNTMFTLSQVKVTAVYKGNVNVGDIIWVVESGGRTTFGDYDANCNVDVKDFEANGQRLPNDYRVVVGTDGYYPLAAEESVLLFLGDTTGFLPNVSGTLYDVIGDTDGKLYAQNDGSYKKASPSQTDNYVFNADNLSVTVDALKELTN